MPDKAPERWTIDICPLCGVLVVGDAIYPGRPPCGHEEPTVQVEVVPVAVAERLAEAGQIALDVLDAVLDSFPDGDPPHPSIGECLNGSQPLRAALEAYEAV